jgi:hypothetical protein
MEEIFRIVKVLYDFHGDYSIILSIEFFIKFCIEIYIDKRYNVFLIIFIPIYIYLYSGDIAIAFIMKPQVKCSATSSKNEYFRIERNLLFADDIHH